MNGSHLSLADAISANATYLVKWCAVAIAVFARPKQWGIWVGILLLLAIGQSALAYGPALSQPHANPNLDWSWSWFSAKWPPKS